MDIVQITQDLIKIPSVSGDSAPIEKIVTYVQDLFKNTDAVIEVIREKDISPVLYIRNNSAQTPDVLIAGHLDVVPASEKGQFIPYIKDGRLYGRGALDMKSSASVAFDLMDFVLREKLPLSVALVLETDEETGSKGMQHFIETHPDFIPKIVLDVDVGGDICEIINKCKCPVFVKLKALGEAVHGSTPWEGMDATERLLQTIQNLRQKYPYYAKDGVIPQDKWVPTMHIGKIKGGDTVNIICDSCEADLDFRLPENISPNSLYQDIENALAEGVSYEVISCGSAVVMDENNKILKEYKQIAEEILGRKIHYQQIGGATTSRLFALKGAFIIYHAPSGSGMHGKGEYVDIESVQALSQIQKRFLKSYSEKLEK